MVVDCPTAVDVDCTLLFALFGDDEFTLTTGNVDCSVNVDIAIVGDFAFYRQGCPSSNIVNSTGENRFVFPCGICSNINCCCPPFVIEVRDYLQEKGLEESKLWRQPIQV